MKIVVKDAREIAGLAGGIIAEAIKQKPNLVLGLATGSTPVETYRELIRLHKKKGLDFSRVVTFNLDEYVGLAPDHEQSYRHFMNTNLFNHINIDKANTHVPDGKAKDIPAFCARYEQMIKKAGGVDLQVLGIGSNGHIAFNEPGTALDSRTHETTLTENTIRDNSRFFSSMDEVPKTAITMGMGTIMEAKKIILIATGANKAAVIAATIEGPVTKSVPASVLQKHQDTVLFLDKDAAAGLKGGKCCCCS